MKIIDCIQGSPEWRAIRAQHNTASEAPVAAGCSKYQSREALLQQKKTGVAPEVDAHTQALFDRGHESEAAARAIVEEMLGTDLYPITAVCEETGLLASVDGISEDDTTLFEHKLWNESLAAQVRAGELEPHYYWQLEQELLVTGAQRVIFVTSDGTRENFAHMEYRPVPGRREQLLGIWRQFDADLQVYEPREATPMAPVGHSPDQLPAIRVNTSGKLVLESNIKEWEAAALAYIKGVREHELVTDADFADADAAAKWCATSKTTLLGVKSQLMAATGDVNVACATIDRIAAELDKTRIAFTNACKERKDERKAEIVRNGERALAEHVAALNQRLGGSFMPPAAARFAEAIKGKSSLRNMEDAVAQHLATAKIAANEVADRLQANLTHLREHASEHKHLFPDVHAIIHKAPDDLATLVRLRISEHKAAEERRLEAERERIRQEEVARLEREQQERIAREQREEQERVIRETRERAESERLERIERDTLEAAGNVLGKVGELRQAGAVPAALADAIENVAGSIATDTVLSRAAANVSPMRVPQGKPTLTLGAIGDRLGFTVTAAFLASLGIPHAAKERSATLYHTSDFDRICAALIGHIARVREQREAA